MSKIGRKPISLENVQVDIKGQEIHFKGKKQSGVHVLPDTIQAKQVDHKLQLMSQDRSHAGKAQWGLHRALLANQIIGVSEGFEKGITITGLGFKGILTGNKLVFSLGFSHKIDFQIPDGVTIEIDKTGQNIKVKGFNKELVGLVCSQISALRPPEPYKGTGVLVQGKEIIRKAGKTKSA
jgi:large subunit ribosomal protein L6